MIAAGEQSRAAFERRCIPTKQPLMKPTRRSAGDPTGQTAGDETHAAFGRRSIPAEPRRCAPLVVAFRSKYTRYSSLTRLVSRAPRRPRRSRGFHHRLFTAPLRAARRCASVEIHSGQFSRWGLLPHAPCQPGASPPPGGLAALGAYTTLSMGCQQSVAKVARWRSAGVRHRPQEIRVGCGLSHSLDHERHRLHRVERREHPSENDHPLQLSRGQQ